MALGYLTWLWISPSHGNTGKLLPFYSLIITSSHLSCLKDLSSLTYVYFASFLPILAQCLFPNYGHISPPLSL